MQISSAARIRLLYFFNFCCQAAWLPRYADYLKGKGFSGFEMGFILSLTPIMMFLVQPLFGFLTDKVGFKKTLLVGALVSGLFFLGHLFQGGFYFVAFVTMVMALFYNSTLPVIDSLALQTASHDPSLSYGNLRIAGALAWSFMGVINGFLIDRFAIQIIFVIASFSMVLSFVLALTLPSKKPSLDSQKQERHVPFYTLFKEVELMLFLFITIFVAITQTTIWNFYSLYMTEIGASSSLTGFGFSLQGLCELPLFYFSAKIIFHFGLKKTLVFTLLVTALRLLLYGLVKDPHLALVIEITHGVSWSLFWVVCVEFTNKLVKVEWLATGQSLLYAAYFGIGAIAGNFWTSFLFEKMSLGNIFLLNAAIMVLTAFFTHMMLKKTKLKF